VQPAGADVLGGLVDLGGKAPPAQNWRDDSVRVGAFVYRGDGSNINFAQG
jgi:hypothetical protein